jgi:hypothetical protein
MNADSIVTQVGPPHSRAVWTADKDSPGTPARRAIAEDVRLQYINLRFGQVFWPVFCALIFAGFVSFLFGLLWAVLNK